MFTKQSIIFFSLILLISSGYSQNRDNQETVGANKQLKDSVPYYLLKAESFLDSLPNKSIDYAEKARALASVFNLYEQEAYANYLLGKSNLSLEKYHLANEFLQLSLIYFSSTKNEELKAYNKYYLGLSEYHNKRYSAAIFHFKAAADLFKALELLQYYANALKNTGLTYYAMNDFQNANKSYLLALEYYLNFDDSQNIAQTYQNLGLMGLASGKDSLAIQHFNKAIEYYKSTHDLIGLGNIFSSKGLYYLNNGSAALAFSNFSSANTHFIKAKYPLGQLWALNNMGSAKAILSEFNNAEHYFHQSLALSVRLKNNEGIISNYEDLSGLYKDKGQYRTAFEYHRNFERLKDSLNSAEAEKQIAKLESLYFQERNMRMASIQDANTKQKKGRAIAIVGFLSALLLAAIVVLSALFQKSNAEKKLAEHKINLEKLVVKRTKELQKQISERKVAEESDKLKSAFLANMSHELRTPMNAIIAFSNFLREPDLSEEKHQEYIDHIAAAGDSLLRLIDDIIDIAKIESKQLKLFVQPTNINRLLNELYRVYSNLEIRTKKRDIKFNLHINNEFNHIINTDSQRLKQVLNNLIENAFKYTDKGSIDMGFESKDKTITFFVSDTGIGIPKDKLDVIFTRFYQLNHIKDRRAGGTGLGLAISKNLINLLGGEIIVDSIEGKGSRFSIKIPVESIKKQPNPVFRNEGKKITLLRQGYNWNNITILVAEDEDLNYKVLDTCLTRTKAHVIRAKDGTSAVEICRNQKVDLVLMDIQMPGMDGYEATQEIKRMNNRTPVIAQTSFAMAGEKERCLQAGCDDFITKPLNIELLLTKIEHYLR